MNLRLIGLLFCVTTLVAACAMERPLARAETIVAIEHELGIAPAVIKGYSICFHVLSPYGTNSGAWRSALYVRTNDRIVIANRDQNSGRLTFAASIPLAELTSIGFHTTGTRAQLQLGVSSSLHGVVLLTDSGGRLDYKASESEWQFLSSLGVKVVASPSNIENSDRGPMFVPIVVK